MEEVTEAETEDEEEEGLVDYTSIPKALDAQYERVDSEGSVRPTIITPSQQWTKRSQQSLLSAPQTRPVDAEEQGAERRRAFDLLDALTKSGGIEVESAALHVVVAATHCFDSSVMDTVIRQNVNPIEKAEQATLVAAATVHGRPPQALVVGEQAERLLSFSPRLRLLEE
jgi:hypothetical protein